ncbi:HAD-IC family P-type ATPase [Streptomyces termitum]|uniref:Metal-transporting ATPase n=1 Tax=Streptomyces termitum TaxID=67368 RepID=A0A918W544_9ACTN|nr:HAD-IC family P-type ATPase [Streptomyces termitum]GHA69778.1 metal-transporting ATPase [Streptomyces termitum]
MPSSLDQRPAPAGDAPRPLPARRRTRVLALPEARWAAASLALFLLALPPYLLDGPGWLWGTLFAAAYATGGWEPGLEGLRALRERTLDVDLLMVVAALGAAAIGQVLDGALLIVIFATSGALEAVATARTEDSVRGLLDLAPATATRLRADGSEETVEAGLLAVGDTVLVRPGERIGADGTVVGGVSEVDQAGITGEPLPVVREAGDEVFAGTVNGTGVLRVRVGRDPEDSVIARIVRMVEEASRTKAPTQLFVEKVEQRYALGMVAATLAVFAVPLALGDALEPALLRAMTFMIVASPCAVVLSTMPPLLSAIANAGRHGVLAKSAVVMERLGRVDTVALDKTGTLTEGTPRLTDVVPLPAPSPTGKEEGVYGSDPDGRPKSGTDGRPGSGADARRRTGSGNGLGADRRPESGNGPAADRLLRLAASAEHGSEHPLARAIVGAALERGLVLSPADAFAATPGRGVAATVDGHRIEVGAPARLLPDGAHAGPARELEEAGKTVVAVVLDGRPAGLLAVADRLRPGAAGTVAALTRLTGRAPALLTGDNERAAQHVAERVGITDVRAGLLPGEKAAAVREWEAAGRRVLVVGDGVNDAPALAAAHCGVAMGRTGSDLALETADAVVVRDELAAVPAVVALSRAAHRLVVQNLVIAGAFIAVLVAWDLIGTLPLPLGVAGHEGSTVLVGLNGLRLLREAAWPRPPFSPGPRAVTEAP